MNIERIKEVFSDREFVMSLLNLETIAEVQAALKEKDIDFSAEEILALRKIVEMAENDEDFAERLVKCVETSEDGELPEELLEQVSGGIGVAAALGIVAAAAGIVACVVQVVRGIIAAFRGDW